jgi:hypothetical protein
MGVGKVVLDVDDHQRRSGVIIDYSHAVIVSLWREPAAQHNFRAHLSGDNEVPAVDTNATGQVTFKRSDDESSLSF